MFLALYYRVMRKGKNMNYIEIESVGSTITEEGMVFPTDCSEAPETASEAEEMMGVHITDCDDEWFMSMSKDDCFTIFEFLDSVGAIDTDVSLPNQGKDFDWASEKYHIAGTYDELSMEMS